MGKDAVDLRSRFEALSELAIVLNDILLSWHMKPPSERRVRRKFDRSRVTGADEEIGGFAWEFLRTKFPGDSFDGEENPNLILGADWSFHVDPVDPTEMLAKYDGGTPEESAWASVLMSYTYRKIALMFAVAMPMKGKTYCGSVTDGIYLNGAPYVPPEPEAALVIGHDESAYRAILDEFRYPRSYMVAPTLALMLEGVARGGVHPIDRPYEANCIIAVARSMNANVTDEFGHECHVGDEVRGSTARLVWSLGGGDVHERLLHEVRERMRDD